MYIQIFLFKDYQCVIIRLIPRKLGQPAYISFEITRFC